MKKKLLLFIIGSLKIISICAQDKTKFLVKPYIQDAEPNSVVIQWETNTGGKTIVEYGLNPNLGKKIVGTSYDVNFTKSRIHKVKLNGLKRFTTYYYRTKTNNTYSDIHKFKTPPFATDNKSFKVVAMSDMQYDYNYPNKFHEIVNDGVLAYLEKEHKGKLSDNLALVMVPGDLVENGSKYEQWKNHFFNPAENLFAEVPVYPVLGNHERNSVFYFKYFSLPENGTPAYAGHWWYKDYGNTRIIGLNSNKGYEDLKEQYTWLENLLEKTSQNKDIDFVFAQLHHPHKSELWIPGERASTGKVIQLLEQFSTKSGKPSLHFFGHTHGYSRGQSKDHKHLWINVASAGGAIDNWGEFEGRDYEEFTVSQDEYGFVLVEVDANEKNPKFTIKRISRGNENTFRDNELRDSITIYKNNQKPLTPRAIAPTDDTTIKTHTALLKANLFKSNQKGAFHAASQWQVSESSSFNKISFESWKQHENWYYKENRQDGDDLTDEKTKRLKPNTTYYWRVRYRDQHLTWSDWSETKSFKTLE